MVMEYGLADAGTEAPQRVNAVEQCVATASDNLWQEDRHSGALAKQANPESIRHSRRGAT
jgi:hypothetical protein